ncbi:MAG: hypothetical protein JWN75_193 [Candidatus Saccharibacteria bacterium]|nr:hypothetical protein [Candidatus Saccharibacteria bacterium]
MNTFVEQLKLLFVTCAPQRDADIDDNEHKVIKTVHPPTCKCKAPDCEPTKPRVEARQQVA